VVWIDVFRGFLAVCGMAVTLFVVIQLWKAMFQMRRDMPQLSPEQRRENWWAGLGTIAGLVLASAAVYGAYKWGEAQWDSRTGAALAIGAFVIAVTVLFVVGIVLARRDASHDRERRAADQPHTSP
jgi:hypothetical protein